MYKTIYKWTLHERVHRQTKRMDGLTKDDVTKPVKASKQKDEQKGRFMNKWTNE